MMVLVLGITSTVLSLENNITTEGAKKTSSALQAIAHIACHGKKGCMATKIKAAKCGGLAKFNLVAVNKSVASYKAGLKSKSVKVQSTASKAFKTAMKPVVACNITPKGMKAAFIRGFKIAKSKKAAKKLGSKAKKAGKKVKKAAKAKKVAKKVKKTVKKAAKKAAKKVGKAKKAGKKAAKKAKKSAKKAVKKAKAGKKGAKKAIKKAAKKVKKAAKKGAKKAAKKAGKVVKKAAKAVSYLALVKSLLALVKLC
jgi:molecular chaperone DnaK (HSP70)